MRPYARQSGVPRSRAVTPAGLTATLLGLGLLALTGKSLGAALTVTVLLPDGHPLGGVIVMARPSSGPTGLVTLGCNIHDEMLAYVVVTDAPFFGLTNKTGAWSADVPSGSYRIAIWHPRLRDESKYLEGEVTASETAGGTPCVCGATLPGDGWERRCLRGTGGSLPRSCRLAFPAL